MVKVKSSWILQEVFVHPEVGGDEIEGSLKLEVLRDCRKKGELKEVVVEIVGVVDDGERQIANLRFVNFSKWKFEGKRDRLLKMVTDEVLSEFKAVIPFFLLKAGIFVKGFSFEV